MSPKTSPAGDREAGQAPGAPLRADAARNVAQIRAAAIAAFHGRGLDTPLEEIAAAAGVSKATIYNRFGGRAGLIDAVIEKLVAAEMYAIMDKALQVSDLWQAIATYVTDRRDLQYREPAFTDALLMTYQDSEQLAAIATAAIDMTTSLVRRCHDAGVVRPDFTAGDLHYADVANGLALRRLPRPDREDYDRRTGFFLDSLRPRQFI
jgi:AcrR family transcriptional regulator